MQVVFLFEDSFKVIVIHTYKLLIIYVLNKKSCDIRSFFMKYLNYLFTKALPVLYLRLL